MAISYRVVRLGAQNRKPAAAALGGAVVFLWYFSDARTAWQRDAARSGAQRSGTARGRWMRYEFGGYILDTDRRELLGSQGAIPLRPKVFGLLAYLIANRDRVVSKQEVFDRLWSGVEVGDATLNTCIKAARQAVGDSGQRQAVIRTWHGVGYRFVAPVDECPGVSASGGPAVPSEPTSAPREPVFPSAPTGTPAAPAIGSLPAGKEHKQVSVLDCVVHEASRLAVRLGPEVMHEAMERFMASAQSTVQGYGGTVVQWSSDGFVALFGAPRAYEDHARRAVSAALDLQRELAETAGHDQHPLRVRIGLHTGPVIVSTTAERIYTAVGETSETARALQRMAPRDAILASAPTHEIIAAEVAAEPFMHEYGDSSRAYVIRGLVARRAGVPGRAGRVLSQFVGRSKELAILLDRSRRSRSCGRCWREPARRLQPRSRS
jgi:class 3 adenylate cyclase